MKPVYVNNGTISGLKCQILKTILISDSTGYAQKMSILSEWKFNPVENRWKMYHINDPVITPYYP